MEISPEMEKMEANEKIVWQLSSCPMSDEANLQKLLADSWEPFSTAMFMDVNALNPREIKQVPIVFLKRGVIMDGSTSGKPTLSVVE